MKRLYQSAKQALSKTAIYLSLFSVVITIIGIVGYEKMIDNLLCRIIVVAAIFILAYTIALIVC